jgi:uncharacterized protein DUF1214
MKTQSRRKCSVSIVGLLLLVSASLAFAAPASSAADANTIPGWKQWTSQLEQLDSQILARLPDRLRNDPQVRQEAGRLLLEAVASRSIAALGNDVDHPVFLPATNFYLNVGQPNADTTYRSAAVDADGSYRIRGDVGSLRILRVGLFGPAPTGPSFTLPIPTYYDFKTLHLDASGRFDVLLSPQRPSGYSGEWWQLKPGTTHLLLRQVDFDWANEHDPRISIERVDRPVERPRPSAADLVKRLQSLGDDIARTALLFVDHVEGLRKEGYINRLKVFDVSHMGGLVGQSYYEGAYELKPDEALIVEAKVPAGCTYWSIILTNDLYETTDWYNNQSSLNGSQARVDPDGVVRYVVSAKDPGVPNWLDTAGYVSGAIQGRWTECTAAPLPDVHKVALADVRKSLPAGTPEVTPEQRDVIVRQRRSELQQRPLW